MMAVGFVGEHCIFLFSIIVDEKNLISLTHFTEEANKDFGFVIFGRRTT